MKKPSRESSRSMRVIREAAKQVMDSLGKGHSERVYHRALITLLNRKGVAHRSEVLTPIYFLGEVVGVGRCDLVIQNLVIELKAVNRCPITFSPQLRKYMVNMGATERKRFNGIIINFNQKSGMVEMHRDHNPKKKKTQTGNARGGKKSKKPTRRK